MIRGVIAILVCICVVSQSQAQFGYGLTAKTGLYERFTNPEDGISSNTSGSALINIGFGPKLWIGGEKFSISAEGAAIIAPFALSSAEFKGMGAASFPFLARLNFGGMSTLNKKGAIGFSIGGGFQWAKTELFGLTSKFEQLGVERKFYKTFVGEITAGFGMSGFAGYAFIRYGRNNEFDVKTFNFGIGYDFNVPTLDVLTDPDF